LLPVLISTFEQFRTNIKITKIGNNLAIKTEIFFFTIKLKLFLIGKISKIALPIIASNVP
jgi:hypothetical protein